MIYLDLFFGFLKVGCFSFGGAYGAIPLIRDVVMSYGWLSDEMLTYMIAVSESTPGPIMVNLATYIGSSQGGFLGALIATFAVILPSFLIIILITALLNAVWKNKYIQAILRGLKPCVIGIVLATGIYMVLSNCLGTFTAIKVDMRALIIAAILVVAIFGYKHFVKKKLSPILLIVISAVAGVVVFGASTPANDYRQITMSEAIVMMEEESNYIILDVRTPEEFADKHIPNAINIPNETIGTEKIPELPDKDQLILVYCRSGNRSKQAAGKLVALGYTNIVEFGGIIDWPGETVGE